MKVTSAQTSLNIFKNIKHCTFPFIWNDTRRLFHLPQALTGSALTNCQPCVRPPGVFIPILVLRMKKDPRARKASGSFCCMSECL